MEHTPFIVAAYAAALLGTLGLAAQSFALMRSRERRAEILPGTGRGTMRSMVEGHVPQALGCEELAPPPSAVADGPPPPMGEDV